MDRRTWIIAVAATVIVGTAVGAVGGYLLDTALVLRQTRKA